MFIKHVVQAIGFSPVEKQRIRREYPGLILMMSHNSMLIAQSGPMSMSLVALSAQAAALLAMSI